MKKKVILLCDVCLARNYSVNKSQGFNKKLELNKFCSNCGKHTIHRETR